MHKYRTNNLKSRCTSICKFVSGTWIGSVHICCNMQTCQKKTMVRTVHLFHSSMKVCSLIWIDGYWKVNPWSWFQHGMGQLNWPISMHIYNPLQHQLTMGLSGVEPFLACTCLHHNRLLFCPCQVGDIVVSPLLHLCCPLKTSHFFSILFHGV
jgi:hypothetical protein